MHVLPRCKLRSSVRASPNLAKRQANYFYLEEWGTEVQAVCA